MPNMVLSDLEGSADSAEIAVGATMEVGVEIASVVVSADPDSDDLAIEDALVITEDEQGHDDVSFQTSSGQRVGLPPQILF